MHPPLRSTRLLPGTLLAALALTAGLAPVGCAPDSDGDGSGGDSSSDTDSSAGTSEDATGDDDGEGDGGDDFSGATLSGTGSYSIPDQAPLGGYELDGDPGTLPDGCTWQILDADGGVYVEDQGAYVFLTDIPEAVTFVTDGCPDWVQFED